MWLTLIGGLFSSAVGLVKSISSEATIRTVAGLKYGAQVSTAGIKAGAFVTRTAMSHNVYWYVWTPAAAVTVGWYVLGMVDTTCHACFPEWAKPHPVPETIRPYFDIVFANIFWSGAAGYAVHTGKRVADRLIDRMASRFS